MSSTRAQKCLPRQRLETASEFRVTQEPDRDVMANIAASSYKQFQMLGCYKFPLIISVGDRIGQPLPNINILANSRVLADNIYHISKEDIGEEILFSCEWSQQGRHVSDV